MGNHTNTHVNPNLASERQEEASPQIHNYSYAQQTSSALYHNNIQTGYSCATNPLENISFLTSSENCRFQTDSTLRLSLYLPLKPITCTTHKKNAISWKPRSETTLIRSPKQGRISRPQNKKVINSIKYCIPSIANNITFC